MQTTCRRRTVITGFNQYVTRCLSMLRLLVTPSGLFTQERVAIHIYVNNHKSSFKKV